jgi:acetyl esterase/lipase
MIKHTTILASIALIFLGGCSRKKPQELRFPILKQSPGTAIPLSNWQGKQERVIWKEFEREDLAMDVYYPPESISKVSPVHVYIHGGGWHEGSSLEVRQRKEVGSVFVRLAAKGYVGFSIDYRLIGWKTDTRLVQQVQDCKDAIRFIYKHKERWNIDPERMGVWGNSSGGHLALMLTVSSDEHFKDDSELADYPSAVKCGVSWYGMVDFTAPEITHGSLSSAARELFGARFTDDADAWKRGSPLSYLNIDTPPILHIHGKLDQIIPFSQAMHLQRAGIERNANVTVIPVMNTGHHWFVENKDTIPSAEDISKITADFIVEYTRPDQGEKSGWVRGDRLQTRRVKQESKK